MSSFALQASSSTQNLDDIEKIDTSNSSECCDGSLNQMKNNKSCVSERITEDHSSWFLQDEGDNDENDIPNNSNNNNSDLKTMSESDMRLEIKNLRDRLYRRNIILDSVRKAYFRDIVTLHINNNEGRRKSNDKEIFHNKYENDNDNCNSPQNENKDKIIIDSSLYNNVTSMDLEPVLPLFAPEQCELRVNQCYHCGGGLEIVHCESQTILDLREKLKRCEYSNRDLTHMTHELKKQALHDRKKLEEETQRWNQLSESYTSQISQMESEIIMFKNKQKKANDYIEKLRKERSDFFISVRNTINETERRTNELDVQFIQCEKEMKNQRETIVELNKTKMSQTETIQTLESKTTELFHQKSSLEGQNQQLYQIIEQKDEELHKCALERERSEKEIEKLTADNLQLQQDIQDQKEEHESILKSHIQEHKEITNELRVELTTKIKECKVYEQKIGNILRDLKSKEQALTKEIERQKEEELRRKRESEEFNKSDAAKKMRNELKIANDHIEILEKVVQSCASGIYDHCVIQENILDDENFDFNMNTDTSMSHTMMLSSIISTENDDDDNKSELEGEKQEHNDQDESGVEEKEDSYLKQHHDNIIEGLKIGEGVETINWRTFFTTEKQTSKKHSIRWVIRLIIYFIQRQKSGFLDGINKMFRQKLHQKDISLRRTKQDTDKRIREIKTNSNKRLRELKKIIKGNETDIEQKEKDLNHTNDLLKESKETNKDLICALSETKHNLESQEQVLKNTNQELQSQKDLVATMNDDLTQKNARIDNLEQILETRGIELKDKEGQISILQQNISQISKIYQETVEKEQWRLATNKNVAIECIPDKKDMGIEAKFIDTPATEHDINDIYYNSFSFPPPYQLNHHHQHYSDHKENNNALSPPIMSSWKARKWPSHKS